MKLVLDLTTTTVQELSHFIKLAERSGVQGDKVLELYVPSMLETRRPTLSFDMPPELLDDLVAN